MTRISVLFLFIALIAGKVHGQTLSKEIVTLAKKYSADVGVGIITPEGDTVSVNGNRRYPMQSVYKFHLALYILDQVDQKKLSLRQEIILTKRDLLPATHSPLRDSSRIGMRVTLQKLLQYTVSYSDNIGCDILFRLAGGPSKVHDFIQAHGVSDVAVIYTEEEMHADWEKQFANYSTPKSMVLLLDKFRKGEILSPSSTKLLMELMQNTTTGTKRLKGNLPEGTIVGHKTGTSGYREGISPATNDAGIVTLPGGRTYSIAVFVSKSRETEETNERIIAEISRMVYDNLK
nr:VEB-PER_beta_lactamase [uncultured bacterium]AIA13500.1 VEB-PER_beta_lactamase [uncultured bacterium]